MSTPACLISTDDPNLITEGADGKLVYSGLVTDANGIVNGTPGEQVPIADLAEQSALGWQLQIDGGAPTQVNPGDTVNLLPFPTTSATVTQTEIDAAGGDIQAAANTVAATLADGDVICIDGTCALGHAHVIAGVATCLTVVQPEPIEVRVPSFQSVAGYNDMKAATLDVWEDGPIVTYTLTNPDPCRDLFVPLFLALQTNIRGRASSVGNAADNRTGIQGNYRASYDTGTGTLVTLVGSAFMTLPAANFNINDTSGAAYVAESVTPQIPAGASVTLRVQAGTRVNGVDNQTEIQAWTSASQRAIARMAGFGRTL